MCLKLLSLYRAKDTHPLLFCSTLENVISCHEIDLVLGDFNINLFNETDSQQLREVMERSSYTQIVKHATFVSAGSLLNHVYIRQDSQSKFKDLFCEIKSVYYSDHECVQVCISDKVPSELMY